MAAATFPILFVKDVLQLCSRAEGRVDDRQFSWSQRGLPPLDNRGRFFAMIKAEILEALPKLSPEERREIRAKLNELDDEEWFDNGELSEQEKAIIEARLDEYDRNA